MGNDNNNNVAFTVVWSGSVAATSPGVERVIPKLPACLAAAAGQPLHEKNFISFYTDV